MFFFIKFEGIFIFLQIIIYNSYVLVYSLIFFYNFFEKFSFVIRSSGKNFILMKFWS